MLGICSITPCPSKLSTRSKRLSVTQPPCVVERVRYTTNLRPWRPLLRGREHGPARPRLWFRLETREPHGKPCRHPYDFNRHPSRARRVDHRRRSWGTPAGCIRRACGVKRRCARRRVRRYRDKPGLHLSRVLQPQHGLPLDAEHVLGVLSMIFWALIIVVAVKYVLLIMRADNQGEGGILALLPLALQVARGQPS